MRTYEEHHAILELWDQGKKKKRIAILTGIPRGTVQSCIRRYQTLEGLEAFKSTHPDVPLILQILMAAPDKDNEVLFKSYAYLLGLYLGDGCITKQPRTFKLRIAFDTHYPNIIVTAIQAIKIVAPQNIVNTVKQQGNCVEVCCHSNHWPAIFPQHGQGKKHTRPIILEGWQRRIVDSYPLEFFRGLFHSDGSRPHNIVNGRDYPRYEFSNYSSDIRQLFAETCDVLGVHWRSSSGGRGIQIARRPDVAFLDQHVGPKS